MIGATALHTRARCDECARPATREGDGGIVLCDGCEMGLPRPANDDVLGQIFNAPRICTRCQIRPAMLRVDEIRVLCSECWRKLDARLLDDIESDSVPSAVPPPDVKVATAALMDLAPASAAVATPFSVSGPSLATGMSRDQANAGGSHEVATALLSEPYETLCREAGTSPGACSSERDEFGATNSVPYATPACAMGAGRDCNDAVSGATGGESAAQVSIPATALGSSPSPQMATMQTADAFCGSACRVGATLEGRGPVEDWTDRCLAVRAVIYPARRGASHRASDSIAPGNNPSPTDVLGGEVAGRDSIPDAELDSIVGWLERQWTAGAFEPVLLTDIAADIASAEVTNSISAGA